MDVFGLLGNPVGHSLSPPMHEAAYRALDLDARYVTFEPAPDDLERAVAGADALGIRGLNVTIPFKESVVPMVDPDTVAKRIGAVNTIDFATDPPSGYNTDAPGARRAFDRFEVQLPNRSVVLVGAGGAARAIAVMLVDAGASVDIANRTVSRGEELARHVNSGVESDATRVKAHGLEAIPSLLESADILINATSVGMEEDRSPVPADAFHDGLTVMDIVYRPLETRLLTDARAAGALTIDGAWMLLFQGVVAFERWTGLDAPVEAMNTALRQRL